MLLGERPNQRVILAGLLRGRELNAVRGKTDLRALLGDEVANLHQLLGERLRGGDQRLQRVGRARHHFLIRLIKHRLQIVRLLQRRTGAVGLHFRVLQLLAHDAQRTVRLAQRLALGHIILRHANAVYAIHYRADASVHRLVHLLRVAVKDGIVGYERTELFFLIGGQRRQTFAATHHRVLQKIDERFALVALFIKTPAQAEYH